MAMRNWWIEATIDGRGTRTIVGGPQSKDGGFELTIQQRDKGKSFVSVTIMGVVRRSDGKLHLVVRGADTGLGEETLVTQNLHGELVQQSGFTITTER